MPTKFANSKMDRIWHSRRETAVRRMRRGVALVIVIVLFVICLALFGVWTRAIVGEQRWLANQQYRLQAARLAEAGVLRAQARRAADPEFQEETWHVPPEALGGNWAGQVLIRLVPADASGAAHVKAVAEFPAGSVRRAQVTKQIEIRELPPGNEP